MADPELNPWDQL